jgi:dihydrodipicolinate synthase/N-acetylneuraminate lyase
VCVAPRLSQTMLAAVQRQDWDEAERIRTIFRPLEDLRNAINPIRVLHQAVESAGIADTGPLLPLLTNVEATHVPAIADAARVLLAANGHD